MFSASTKLSSLSNCFFFRTFFRFEKYLTNGILRKRLVALCGSFNKCANIKFKTQPTIRRKIVESKNLLGASDSAWNVRCTGSFLQNLETKDTRIMTLCCTYYFLVKIHLGATVQSWARRIFQGTINLFLSSLLFLRLFEKTRWSVSLGNSWFIRIEKILELFDRSRKIWNHQFCSNEITKKKERFWEMTTEKK